MSTILAVILIILAFYFVLFDPIKFLFLYGATAAYNEARGIEGFLSSGYIPYTLFMQFLLFFVFLRCLSKRFKLFKNERIMLICCASNIILVIISCVLGGHIFSFPIYLAQNCPIYLIILFSYRDKVNILSFVIKLVTFHIIVAFLIIYLPVFGVNILEPLQGNKYIYSPYTTGSPATLTNFYRVFSYKYQFNLSAQFHNPNDTSFFGVVGIVIYFSLFKKYKKYRWLVLMLVSATLWINGGSRGAMLGFIMGILASFIMSKNHSKKTVIALVMMNLIIIALSTSTVQSYIISALSSKDYGSIYSSLNSRKGLRDTTIELVKHSPLFGTGGMLGNGSIDDINITQYAHELPLRQAVLFGIPVGIIVLLMVYVIPIVHIFKKKKFDFISLGFYFIALFSTMTNGYLCPMMVYLMVYICVFEKDVGVLLDLFKKQKRGSIKKTIMETYV